MINLPAPPAREPIPIPNQLQTIKSAMESIDRYNESNLNSFVVGQWIDEYGKSLCIQQIKGINMKKNKTPMTGIYMKESYIRHSNKIRVSSTP